MIIRLPLALLAVSVLATATTADEFSAAAQNLCNTVKTCVMQQMNQEELTPDMRQMIEPMVQNMCDTMQQSIDEVPRDNAAYPAAVACMESLSRMSCSQLETIENSATPECTEYENRVRQQAPNS